MKNKIYAMALVLLGVLAMMLEHDATFLVLTSVIAVPMFLSKKSWTE